MVGEHPVLSPADHFCEAETSLVGGSVPRPWRRALIANRNAGTEAQRGKWAGLSTALSGSADSIKAVGTEQEQERGQSRDSARSLGQFLSSLTHQVHPEEGCAPFVTGLSAVE